MQIFLYELYELQDRLEQYTRENSLEIHGVPESAYSTTEEVVSKLAEALVPITPQDVEISHNLKRKGNKPIIVKFANHKIKSNIYKSRTKLKKTSKYVIDFLAPMLLLVLRGTVSSYTKTSHLTERR